MPIQRAPIPQPGYVPYRTPVFDYSGVAQTGRMVEHAGGVIGNVGDQMARADAKRQQLADEASAQQVYLRALSDLDAAGRDAQKQGGDPLEFWQGKDGKGGRLKDVSTGWDNMGLNDNAYAIFRSKIDPHVLQTRFAMRGLSDQRLVAGMKVIGDKYLEDAEKFGADLNVPDEISTQPVNDMRDYLYGNPDKNLVGAVAQGVYSTEEANKLLVHTQKTWAKARATAIVDQSPWLFEHYNDAFKAGNLDANDPRAKVFELLDAGDMHSLESRAAERKDHIVSQLNSMTTQERQEAERQRKEQASKVMSKILFAATQPEANKAELLQDAFRASTHAGGDGVLDFEEINTMRTALDGLFRSKDERTHSDPDTLAKHYEQVAQGNVDVRQVAADYNAGLLSDSHFTSLMSAAEKFSDRNFQRTMQREEKLRHVVMYQLGVPSEFAIDSSDKQILALAEEEVVTRWLKGEKMEAVLDDAMPKYKAMREDALNDRLKTLYRQVGGWVSVEHLDQGKANGAFRDQPGKYDYLRKKLQEIDQLTEQVQQKAKQTNQKKREGGAAGAAPRRQRTE